MSVCNPAFDFSLLRELPFRAQGGREESRIPMLVVRRLRALLLASDPALHRLCLHVPIFGVLTS